MKQSIDSPRKEAYLSTKSTFNCIKCGATLTIAYSPFGLPSNAKYCLPCKEKAKGEATQRSRAKKKRRID